MRFKLTAFFIVAYSIFMFATASICIPTPGSKQFTVSLQTSDGDGSGVLVKQGILTAFHVVENISYIKIIFNNNEVLPGFLTKYDKENDLALVMPLYKNEHYINLGNMPEQGDEVYSWGNGAQGNMAIKKGIVSELRDNFLLLNYAFFPGDSGGPILNRDNELIGICTSTYYYQIHLNPFVSTIIPTYGKGTDIKAIKKFLDE